MKKWHLADYGFLFLAVCPVLISLGIQFFTGDDAGNLLSLCLNLTAGICAQLLALRIFTPRILKCLPLILTGLYALWSLWLYCTSPAWAFAALGDLFADCLAPAVGCLGAWFLSGIKTSN